MLKRRPGNAGATLRLRLAVQIAVRLGALPRAGRRLRHRLLRRAGAPPLRILIARRVRLGDLVAGLPLLDLLRERAPTARIELGGTGAEPAATLALGKGRADALHVFDEDPRRLRLRHALDALRLAVRGYDVLITGERFALLRASLLCGAPLRIGFDDGHPLRRLCTHRVPFDPARHAADNLRSLASVLPERAPARSDPHARTDEAPRIHRERWAHAEAHTALRARLAIPVDVALVVLHPGAQKPSRRWPAERFTALAERLLARDARRWIVLTGGPEERPLAEAVRRGVPPGLRERVRVAAGATRLTQLLTLLCDARLAVCNDTGVLHVARALGVPLLALLGPEDDRLWGPYPSGEAPAVSLRHRVPCAPCKRFDCEPLYCLRALGVEEVWREAERLLSGRCGSALRRIEVRDDWRALARAGFALPIVSVLAPAPAEEAAYPAVRLLHRADDARPASPAPDGIDLAPPAAPGTALDLGEAVALLQRHPRLAAVRLVGAGPRAATGGVVLSRNSHGTLELRPHG